MKVPVPRIPLIPRPLVLGLPMLGVLMVGTLGSGPAFAVELLNTRKESEGFDETRVNVGGFVQPRFVRIPEDKPNEVPGEVGFQVRRARLEFASSFFELGPESHRTFGLVAKTSIELMPEARLVDAYVDAVARPILALRVGQFKTPTSRTLLVSDRNTALPERPDIDTQGPQRQIGAMVHGHTRKNHLEYGLGAFNGEGTNRLGNVNRKFLYAGRVVVSPWGGPGTEDELLGPTVDPTLSLGYATWFDVAGEEGQEDATIAHNAEFFAHWRWLNLQSEYLWRFTDFEQPVLADFTGGGFYVQAASFLVGVPWAEDHISLVGRYEQADPFVSTRLNVPLTGPTDPAQGRRGISAGLGFYVGPPWFERVQDMRLQVLWTHYTETENQPFDNDELVLASHLAF